MRTFEPDIAKLGLTTSRRRRLTRPEAQARTRHRLLEAAAAHRMKLSEIITYTPRLADIAQR